MQAKTEHKGKKHFIGNSFRGIFNLLKPKNERSTSYSKLAKNHSETDHLENKKKNKGKEKEMEQLSSTTDSEIEETGYSVKLRPPKTLKALKSIQLESLITEQSTPELWRMTSVYEVMEQFNIEAVERFSNRPWYTQQAILTSLTTQQQITFHPIKNEQILLLRQMLEQLDKGYQKYLEETKDEFKQADALVQYLRTSIKALLSDDFANADSLESAIDNYERQSQLPKMEFIDEQQSFHLRAFFQVERLCLHRASSSSSLDQVLPYLKDALDTHLRHVLEARLEGALNTPTYNDLVVQLREKTGQACYLSTQNKQSITAQRLAMDAGRAPKGFVSLRAKIKPDNDAFKTAVIKTLSLDFYQTNQTRPTTFPKCTTVEADFFIPKQSSLKLRLSKLIDDFAEEHRKFKLDSNPKLIEPFAKDLAAQLKAALLYDDRGYQHQVNNSPSLGAYI